MTHLAELEPRRRRPWLIALPLAIVVALGVAWTALSFWQRMPASPPPGNPEDGTGAFYWLAVLT